MYVRASQRLPQCLSSRACSARANTLQRRLHTAQYKPVHTPSQIDNRNRWGNVVRLVEGYKKYAHLTANIDPVGTIKRESGLAQLEPSTYGLQDSSARISTEGIVYMDKKEASVEDITRHLRSAYAGNVAAQFSGITEPVKEEWIASHIEKLPYLDLSVQEKTAILRTMTECELFDHFMQKKFASVKRYGCEGMESMVAGLQTLLENSAENGVTDVVITMAHRGRLNILAGLLGLPAEKIFWKSKGESEIKEGVEAIGDVLSHLGHSADLDINGKKLHVIMIENSSHLESSNPVAMGKVRARQARLGDSDKSRVLCVTIHGDAAFAGQGVVPETFELSQLKGFSVGGTVHLICNNQIGFTTESHDGRSTRYAADLAKMVDAPIVHVNADEPEDVVKVCRLAGNFRKEFKSDIVIDVIGYRRNGHNEMDEPSFTQPTMYKHIRSAKSVVHKYAQRLQAEAEVTEADHKSMKNEAESKLDAAFRRQEKPKESIGHFQSDRWKNFVQCRDATQVCETGVSAETLQRIVDTSVRVPDGWDVHSRLRKGFVDARLESVRKDQIDWTTAEAMAFGSLLLEGYNVRLSGQDVGRGTFSHRHIEISNQQDGKRFIPLNQLGEGVIEPVNSPLSEAAVLGFEYGYSIEDPNSLVIWEAQFGDFANSAQTMIDVFITCGESKWLKQSGLVMSLPHGYDGAGPEHSSGRVERFLQAVDSDAIDLENPRNLRPNLQVVNITTPANIFHVLRRQMKRNHRTPLIIMGPKTLLRNSKVVSKMSEFTEKSHFSPVIGDSVDPSGVKRLLFVSGKYYYDIEAERTKHSRTDTAIIRIEEIAPFPLRLLRAEIAKYGNANEYIYCQEEPQNSGAWSFVQPRLSQLVDRLGYRGRDPCPATAVGTSPLHKAEAARLMQSIFE